MIVLMICTSNHFGISAVSKRRICQFPIVGLTTTPMNISLARQNSPTKSAGNPITYSNFQVYAAQPVPVNAEWFIVANHWYRYTYSFHNPDDLPVFNKANFCWIQLLVTRKNLSTASKPYDLSTYLNMCFRTKACVKNLFLWTV